MGSRAIIQHAKEISQQLMLTTTAEGIESEEVLEIAKDYGINNGPNNDDHYLLLQLNPQVFPRVLF